MYRALGAAALLAIAITAPVQDAAAQDPLGGAILGGAAGAILGGAMGGGRGAAIGAIVGGATGAAIAAQGQPRPGGYRYYQQACYQQRGDGAWVVAAPEYCAAAAEPVEVAPPPPRGRIVRDELQDRMLGELHAPGRHGSCPFRRPGRARLPALKVTLVSVWQRTTLRTRALLALRSATPPRAGQLFSWAFRL